MRGMQSSVLLFHTSNSSSSEMVSRTNKDRPIRTAHSQEGIKQAQSNSWKYKGLIHKQMAWTPLGSFQTYGALDSSYLKECQRWTVWRYWGQCGVVGLTILLLSLSLQTLQVAKLSLVLSIAGPGAGTHMTMRVMSRNIRTYITTMGHVLSSRKVANITTKHSSCPRDCNAILNRRNTFLFAVCKAGAADWMPVTSVSTKFWGTVKQPFCFKCYF